MPLLCSPFFPRKQACPRLATFADWTRIALTSPTNSADDPDFYADWCGPCRQLSPTLEAVAEEMPGVRIVKVNVDHSPGLAGRYGIRAIPNLILFRHGEVIARHEGAASKSKLMALLAQ
jgi:thioredoxin